MAVDKKVEIVLTADGSGVAKGVAVAQGALAKLQTQLGAMEGVASKAFVFAGLGGIGVAATAAAAGMVALVKSAANYGDQLDAMSQRTGVAVEELSKLQYAAKLSDTSSEALGKGLGYLSRLMVAAAGGAEQSAKLFDKFGVSVRNQDGTIRNTSEVLYDLADIFSTLPDGPEKTALATEFFGKKLGQELIPLLNSGSAALREMGDEAERLGLILSGEQAKAAADFNDELDRLAASSKGAAVTIGSLLIPTLNDFFTKLNDANRSGLSFWQRLGIQLEGGANDPTARLKEATAQLEKLKTKRDQLLADNQRRGVDTQDFSAYDREIAAQDRLVKYFELQNKRIVGDDEETASKRLTLVKNLAAETVKLETLKAIAAGKASADILKTDKDRVAEQIKDAEKLREALQKAWETSRKEALKAAEDAQKLLEKAAGVRTSATDKANELRNAGLSDEEKQALALAQALDLQSQGDFYAAAAASAKLDGRTQAFETYQKQAEQFLDRAMKFAEASANPDVIEGVGEGQARLIESQARAKQAEAAALEAQAAAQAETIKKLDADITDLKTKAASIEIKVDITQAEGQIASLQAQLDKLSDKTVTVTMQTVAADINSAGLEGFSSGGWTGPGPRLKPAGIVHANEFVTRSERVMEPGALAFLSLFNRIGMRALNGYANGGLVSSMNLPGYSAGGIVGQSNSGSTVNLTLDGHSYRMHAAAPVASALVDAVRREALRKGGRR